jgi:hypothetical protein
MERCIQLLTVVWSIVGFIILCALFNRDHLGYDDRVVIIFDKAHIKKTLLIASSLGPAVWSLILVRYLRILSDKILTMTVDWYYGKERVYWYYGKNNTEESKKQRQKLIDLKNMHW